MKNTATCAAVALVMLAGLLVTGAASPALAESGSNAAANHAQTCDLSVLPCWTEKKKCNIKFRNRTGVIESTGCGSKSRTYASTIGIAARDYGGNTHGNKVTIDAGQSGTINLENDAKLNFFDIRVSTPGNEAVGGTNLSCDQIIQVIQGSGTCKVHVVKGGKLSNMGDDGAVWLSCDAEKICIKGDL